MPLWAPLLHQLTNLQRRCKPSFPTINGTCTMTHMLLQSDRLPRSNLYLKRLRQRTVPSMSFGPLIHTQTHSNFCGKSLAAPRLPGQAESRVLRTHTSITQLLIPQLSTRHRPRERCI